jgi:hypothetical protein
MLISHFLNVVIIWDTALCRMPSSKMLHCVALVRTDVLEELSASTIRVTRISELGTMLAITSNRPQRACRMLLWLNSCSHCFFFLSGWSGTKSTSTEASYWPTVPALNNDDCGAISGMNDWQGNWSTRRKPGTVPLWSPQIPHLTCL